MVQDISISVGDYRNKSVVAWLISSSETWPRDKEVAIDIIEERESILPQSFQSFLTIYLDFHHLHG